MLNYQDQIRLYEFLVKTDRNLPGDLEKNLLDNAVVFNIQLCAVKDQAE